MIIQSKPLKKFNKRIGHNEFCNRNIYSDLIAACPSKKRNKSCLYCFNENLEKLYGFKRGFKLGFSIEQLEKEVINLKNECAEELKKLHVIRINANTDFYPQYDKLHSEHISTFTKNKIKVVAITKQNLMNIPRTIDSIRVNGGVIHVTFNFFNKEIAKIFEPDHCDNIAERKKSIEYFLTKKDMKENIVLRISPIILGINDQESLEIMEWFMKLGGEKVCIEFLRNPNNHLKNKIKQFGGLIPESMGHYKTEQVLPLIKLIKEKNKTITICANNILNDKFGFTQNCCWL